MSKRLLSALVALCMALTLMPSWAFAEEPAETPEPPVEDAGEVLENEEDSEEVPENPEDSAAPEEEGSSEDSEEAEEGETPEEENLPTDVAPEDGETPEEEETEEPFFEISEEEFPFDDEMREMMLQAVVSAILNDEDLEYGSGTVSEDYGGTDSKFSAAEKRLYNELKVKIRNLAEGKNPDGSTPSNNQATTTFSVDSGYSTSMDLGKIIQALMQDFPAYLYWWGRSTGYSYNQSTNTILSISLKVAENYCPSGSTGEDDKYVLDTGKLARVQTAKTNAQKIVTQYASASNYDKLKGYMEEICKLVSYDYDALANSNADKQYASKDSDPWAMISVFDGDEGTNVVCEGYSKAFQYLCDRTEWSLESDVVCYTVTGDMTGGTGAGPHMWNIVSIDGTNYLVDVTNCDYNGKGFSNLVNTDQLFLVGAAEGKATMEIDGVNTEVDAYIVTTENFPIPGTDSYLKGSDIYYIYGDDAKATYQDDVLTLASKKYAPPKVLSGTVTISGTPTVGQTLTARANITSTEPGTLTYTWNIGGKTATGTTYTILPADAGKKITVTVTAANYEGGKIVSDEITVGELTKPTAADFTNTIQAAYAYTGTSMAETLKDLVSSTKHSGKFTVKFSADPLNVGTYNVLVDVEAHDAYAGASDLKLAEFKIVKAAPALSIAGGNSMNIGSTLELTATVAGLDGLDGLVRWTISGTGATISPATGKTTTVTSTAVGSVSVTATLPETGNYEGTSVTHRIEISLKPVQRIAFEDLTTVVEVGDEVLNPATVGLPEGVEEGVTGLVSYSSSDPAVATVDPASGTVTGVSLGTVTITATVAATEEFASASASYELEVVAEIIEPFIILADGPHTYTGEPITPGVTVLKEEDGEELTLGGDYTLEWADNIDVGTASVTVKPVPGGRYSWEAVTDEFAIEKAAPKARTAEATHGATVSGVQSLPLEFGDCGGVDSTSEIVVSDPNSILNGEPSFTDSVVLRYTLAGKDNDTVPEEGWTATLTFTLTARNYDIDYTVTVKVLPLPVPQSPSLTLTYTQTDGAHYTVTATATAVDFAESGLEYSFDGGTTYSDTNSKTVEAGEFVSVRARVKAKDTVNVEGAPSIPQHVHTPPAFTPNGGTFSSTCQVTLSAPAFERDAEAEPYVILYRTDGTAPEVEDVVWNEEEGKYVLQEGSASKLYDPATPISINATTTIKTAVVYKYVALVDNQLQTILEITDIGTARFTKHSSSSGGGNGGGTVIGGSSKPSSKPSTPTATPNTPGVSSGSGISTATPNATVKDGVASAVVSGSIGQNLVDQAAENGSNTVVVSPSIPSAADQTDVSIGSSVVSDLAKRTEADLRVETPAADVTISNKGLSSLAGKGGSLVVSTTSKGDSIDVSITAGGSKVDRVTGGVTVEIPASCTYGTVAMVTKADGSTELVRKSVANADYSTVTVPLEGSATITLVDNSKSFRDVPAGNTFANAVDFVSSREIMNGTGADTFNPSAPLTRAQLAKILHNLESTPAAASAGNFSDVAGDAWCAEAVQWAASQGIVTGYGDGSFKPNAYITREQLAVMLYRYAGSPNASSSGLGFSDAAQVGGYAQTAMAWATQNRVINGSGGMLNPKGQATRAQAAQMLFNFMNNVG